MITYLTLFLCLLKINLSKICWKECDPSKNVIQSVNVANCTRRSTYPELEDFWCDGEKGPPCFVQKGKTEAVFGRIIQTLDQMVVFNIVLVFCYPNVRNLTGL